MLNILERYDLKADGPRSPGRSTASTEAMRRGFFTRATAIADPDFVDVPCRSDLEGPRRRTRPVDRRPRDAQRRLAPFPVLGAEGSDTTHLSTLDADGNAVALTYTLEEGYGAKAVVAGAGFLLNNEMGDFNLIPGRTDATGRIGTPANLIARASGCSARRRRRSCSRTARSASSPARPAAGRSRTRRSGSCSTCWSSASAPRGRRRPADPPPLVPRRPDARRPDLADPRPAHGLPPGPHAPDRRHPGRCPLDRRRPGHRHHPRRRRPASRDLMRRGRLTPTRPTKSDDYRSFPRFKK